MSKGSVLERTHEHSNSRSPGLYAWTKDLEASVDVRINEKAGFAMLLGWLDKFLCNRGLATGREACARFWKEVIKSKARETWQLVA